MNPQILVVVLLCLQLVLTYFGLKYSNRIKSFMRDLGKFNERLSFLENEADLINKDITNIERQVGLESRRSSTETFVHK